MLSSNRESERETRTPPTAPSFSNWDPTLPPVREEKVPPAIPPRGISTLVVRSETSQTNRYSPASSNWAPTSPSDLNFPPTSPALSPLASPAEKALAALFKASPTVSERAGIEESYISVPENNS